MVEGMKDGRGDVSVLWVAETTIPIDITTIP